MNSNMLLRVAAIIILAAGIGIALYIKLSSTEKPETIIAGNESLKVELPDHSTVVLNKNSSKQYAFSKKIKRGDFNR